MQLKDLVKSVYDEVKEEYPWITQAQVYQVLQKHEMLVRLLLRIGGAFSYSNYMTIMPRVPTFSFYKRKGEDRLAYLEQKHKKMASMIPPKIYNSGVKDCGLPMYWLKKQESALKEQPSGDPLP